MLQYAWLHVIKTNIFYVQLDVIGTLKILSYSVWACICLYNLINTHFFIIIILFSTVSSETLMPWHIYFIKMNQSYVHITSFKSYLPTRWWSILYDSLEIYVKNGFSNWESCMVFYHTVSVVILLVFKWIKL